MRVAINGFGRIGRSVFRILEEVQGIDVVAINDLFDPDALRYLLNYDTVMGPFSGSLKLEDGHFVTGKGRVRLLAERNPADLPWAELGVDVVVEGTGVFRAREQLQQHLDAGAGRVILTVPSKDPVDYTVVLGVNDEGLQAEHRIVSNASCTTNCLVPMARVLNDEFGIVEGVINIVHATPTINAWRMCRTRIGVAAAQPQRTSFLHRPVLPRRSDRYCRIFRAVCTASPRGYQCLTAR